MKVTVHDFDVDMVFGNNGITMQVHDTSGELVGKLRMGRATIEWCSGRTRLGNGVKKKWNDVISFFTSVPAVRRLSRRQATAAYTPRRTKPRKGRRSK